MFSKQSKFRGFNAHAMTSIQMLIWMLVVVLVGVVVVLPVTINVTEQAGLTGLPGTIVSYLSVFIGIFLLLAITGVFG